jgi:putative solute:sodium symporter small subunit
MAAASRGQNRCDKGYAHPMFTRSSQHSSAHRPLQWLTAALLALWAAASFGVVYGARELSFLWGDWPFSFWMTAQGSVLVFLAITVIYAVVANRLDGPSNQQDHDQPRETDAQP